MTTGVLDERPAKRTPRHSGQAKTARPLHAEQ